MLHLIPNGNIWFKSFLFSPHVGRKEEIRDVDATHIQTKNYPGVYWVHIIWMGLNQMHKLSHLNVNICPKYIFSLSSGGEAHSSPFSPSFSNLLYGQWETDPSPVGSFLHAVLQLSDPERPHLDACLCFSVSGRDRESPGGRKRGSQGERAGHQQWETYRYCPHRLIGWRA